MPVLLDPAPRSASQSGDIQVKICGLRTIRDVDAAAQAGARYGGFVFFPKSPRHLSFDEAAKLATHAPVGLAKVALVVDPSDADLEQLLARVPVDIVQLHGKESPDRVAELRRRTGLPIMKAVGIADASDLPNIASYEAAADMILVDAKPPKSAVLPGGNGLSFDWRLLQGRSWRKPWMLAGGLTPDTVSDAIRLTGAAQVDVSSGVEPAPGVKDPELMMAFVAAARSALSAG